MSSSATEPETAHSSTLTAAVKRSKYRSVVMARTLPPFVLRLCDARPVFAHRTRQPSQGIAPGTSPATEREAFANDRGELSDHSLFGVSWRHKMKTRRPLRPLPRLALAAVAVLVVYAGLTPWALHIGGRSTPLERWVGYGAMQASNGGKYVLYAQLQGGAQSGRCSFVGGCDTLHGSARLCSESGATHTFTLSGTVDGWWTTDGAPTWIRLTGGTPTPLPPGWVIALHGIWHGPALELTSPDNSFTKVLTPGGEIRQTTSTEDDGTAHVTLRYGSEAEFEAACRVPLRN
jgi:hypothetical protein